MFKAKAKNIFKMHEIRSSTLGLSGLVSCKELWVLPVPGLPLSVWGISSRVLVSLSGHQSSQPWPTIRVAFSCHVFQPFKIWNSSPAFFLTLIFLKRTDELFCPLIASVQCLVIGFRWCTFGRKTRKLWASQCILSHGLENGGRTWVIWVPTRFLFCKVTILCLVIKK